MATDLTDLSCLLGTAQVHANKSMAPNCIATALCDTGSQLNFITEALANKLKLKRSQCNYIINGIGLNTSHSRGIVTLTIASIHNSDKIEIEAVILPKITNRLPEHAFDVRSYLHLRGLSMADPNFNRPKQIDILLGATAWAQAIRNGIQRGSQHEPVAVHTLFGWVLLGPIRVNKYNRIALSATINQSTENDQLQMLLARHWELENFAPRKFLSEEENFCEQHFISTVKRNDNGRYIVEMPIRANSPSLGPSRNIAIIWLKRIEKSLARNPNARSLYNEFMNKYVALGHMRSAPPLKPGVVAYYMPHHFVQKRDGNDAKFRVVFNASNKTENGVSLNDIQATGEKLQNNLPVTILRSRLNKIVLTADVSKMYRQVLINEKHLNYQRIVWRAHPSDPITDYQLLTVTYGQRASPHLAVRAMQQCAKDHEKQYPTAAKLAMTDFYVDDFITSIETEDAAIHVYETMNALMAKGGFELCKWQSNDPNVNAIINNRNPTTQLELQIKDDKYSSMLGIKWNSSEAEDIFVFSIERRTIEPVITKRVIAQQIARLYDPTGLIMPLIVKQNLMLQQLWRLKVDWDEPVPEDVRIEWIDQQKDLHNLNMLKIPRWICYTSECTLELHGFCDASSLAYGAAVYARVTDPSGRVCVNLLSTKSKVAPIKTLTIPRLELNGAKMLTELMETVREALNVPQENCTFWCDSTIVLRWLEKELSSLDIYNANRVSYILERCEPSQWRHVPTDFNPADLISRGKLACELIDNPIWWHGPSWLIEHQEKWPQLKPTLSAIELENARKGEKSEKIVLTTTNAAAIIENNRGDVVDRFSSLHKVKTTVAIVFRFINNFTHRYRPKICPNQGHGRITTEERSEALNFLIKKEQHLFCSQEIEACRTNVLSKNSPLFGLHPFFDSNGLLRVAGRINNSNLPMQMKFPIVVPAQGKILNHLLRYSHARTGHGGCDAMLMFLRQEYYIVHLRKYVKTFIHKCVKCTKANARTAQQQMGQLPAARITPGRSFEDTGIDYFGPFTLKLRPGRCKQMTKAYGIIFKCLRTKAVAIELVEDMTTASFLHAFARVCNTRGHIKRAWADNGSYFWGAANEFKKIQELWESIQRSAEWQERGTEWMFIPPASPHRGGAWERDIKTIKGHIHRLIGNHILTPEELRTLFIEISAYINSRPLVPVFDNDIGASAITPAHFLIGGPIIAPLTNEVQYKNISFMKRWKLVQEMAETLWQNWSKECVINMFERKRWKVPIANIKVDDIVLVKHETLVRTKWPLARVLNVFPGKDGLVRTVEVLMHGSRFMRSIQKLCILPIDHESDLTEN